MDGLSTTEAPFLGWMSALADPTRARTLRLVERHELTVADLCSVLQAPQSTVSRHLKVLSDDGWLAVRPEGTSRLYRLATDALDPAALRLWALLREQAARMPVTEEDDRRLARVLAERRSRSQAFFSSSAGQWDRVRREMFGERFDLRALAALLDPSLCVGDLGCGTGQIAEVLAPCVDRVIAIESSAEMLQAAHERLDSQVNVELRRGELEALPIDDATLDAATMCLVLHHVADPAQVLRETARVLRPGGRFLAVDMMEHERAEYQREMGHVWLGFPGSSIERWLVDAGFEGVRIRPLPAEPQAKGPSLFVATATKNGHRIQVEQRNHNGDSTKRRSAGGNA
jgi:SAM-dependent methyltransferase